MPDQCANECLPHLLKAEKNSPDSPAPIVWVYPMREYTSSNDASLLKEMHEGDNFICDAINNGFPLCCVVSTDNFLKHSADIYRSSMLITPVPINPAITDKLIQMSNEGIKTVVYGTREKLSASDSFTNVSIEDGVESLFKALSDYGYRIEFNKKRELSKPPTMSVSRRDNALFFSAYNADTTTETKFKFPLGAPILCGCETELDGGYSSYRFARSEHRECRVFVKQDSGVISCREAAPVNARFRRAIKLQGFDNATVMLFPENGCECAVSTLNGTDMTPIFDEEFTLVHDENGTYLRGENISGNRYFLIGHKGTEK